jgi:hypothetical protein
MTWTTIKAVLASALLVLFAAAEDATWNGHVNCGFESQFSEEYADAPASPDPLAWPPAGLPRP